MPPLPTLLYQFRFHTGSIKSVLVKSPLSTTSICFDSILVRLKVYNDTFYLLNNRFRFHTGSIKSVYQRIRNRNGSDRFRFHTGSIKSDILFSESVTGFSFDSILVRLKAPHRSQHCPTQRSFDSILVRLKDRLRRRPQDPGISVSIPYWFD